MSLLPTVWQTVGPFFHLGQDWLNSADIAAGAAGERMTIAGRVLDGDGQPVPDAMIEIWQANAEGRYAHPEDRQNKPLDPGFMGFARIKTDGAGGFRLTTIRPGAVPAPGGGQQAPHILVGVFARGVLKRLVTRLYFSDEATNAADRVLQLVPAERRPTLIAQKTSDGYRWDIVLQGENETVFFDC